MSCIHVPLRHLYHYVIYAIMSFMPYVIYALCHLCNAPLSLSRRRRRPTFTRGDATMLRYAWGLVWGLSATVKDRWAADITMDGGQGGGPG